MTATTQQPALRWTEKTAALALAYYDNAESRRHPRREPYEVIDLAVKHAKYTDSERGFLLTREEKAGDGWMIGLRAIQILEEYEGFAFDETFRVLTESLGHAPSDAAYMLAQVCEHGLGVWDGLTIERTSAADSGRYTVVFWADV